MYNLLTTIIKKEMLINTKLCVTLITLSIVLTIYSCGSKQEPKEKSEKDIYIEKLNYQEFDILFRYRYGKHNYIFDYIYEKKLNDRYSRMLIYDISSNISYVAFEKDSTADTYLFVRYINLKDSLPTLQVMKTSMNINAAIESSIRQNYIKFLENIEDQLEDIKTKE